MLGHRRRGAGCAVRVQRGEAGHRPGGHLAVRAGVDVALQSWECAADRGAVEAAREISWRPLGELFVENGLLSEEQLEQALAEQAAMGGRLGDKLVELRYVTRHALARLLAEQT